MAPYSYYLAFLRHVCSLDSVDVMTIGVAILRLKDEAKCGRCYGNQWDSPVIELQTNQKPRFLWKFTENLEGPCWPCFCYLLAT